MKNMVFVTSMLLLLSACNQSDTKVPQKITDTVITGKNSTQYTCPMHPEVVQNKAGVCPKCHMDLVKK